MHKPRSSYASCRAALVAAALLAWASPAGATVDSVVQGVIQDELLTPLSAVRVVLHDTRGQLVAESQTSETGSFLFQGIPFGEYNVEAKPIGRTEAHQHIQVSSSEVVRVALYCIKASEKEVIVEAREVGTLSHAAGSIATLGRESLSSLPQGDDRPLTEVVTTQAGFVQDAFGNVYARGNHANVQFRSMGFRFPTRSAVCLPRRCRCG